MDELSVSKMRGETNGTGIAGSASQKDYMFLIENDKSPLWFSQWILTVLIFPYSSFIFPYPPSILCPVANFAR